MTSDKSLDELEQKEKMMKSTYLLPLVLIFTLFGATGTALDGIKVTIEKQDTFQKKKQKVIVRVKNEAKGFFKGTVSVKGLDAEGKSVDYDTLFFTDEPLSGSGSEQFAILWFKNPDKLNRFTYQVSGSIIPDKQTKIDVSYEEVGTHPGTNYMTIFIYTAKKDRASLKKIAKVYDKRFSTLNGFQIFFFNNKKHTPKRLPMSKLASKALFADYFKNRRNKKSGLTLH